MNQLGKGPSILLQLSYAAYGITIGIMDMKYEINRKKSILLKLSPIIPILVTAPLLIEEGMASIKGLRLLKSFGASGDIMRTGTLNLLKYYGSYIVVALDYYFMYVTGVLLGRLMYRNWYAYNTEFE